MQIQAGQIQRNSFAHRIRARKRARIEDKTKVPFVDGVNHVPVFSSDEAIRIFKYGEKRLHKSRTSINESSSRSHADNTDI
jgi:hypothetical protein